MRTKKFIMGLALISVTHQSFAFEMGGHKIGGGYNPPTPQPAKVEAPKVVTVSSALPLVNKLGKNAFNTEIAARIESALGKYSQSATLNPSVVYYETFPAKNILPLTDVKMVPRSDDSDSVVLTDYVSIPGQDLKGSALGLRMALAPEESRLKASQQMAENGLIKTGDILVSTRPLFANSLQYLALQLLATHISMAVVVTENGKKFVYNLDMPMDAEMLGGKAIGFAKSVMDANHFAGDNLNLMLHVLRPRLETEQQRQNIQKWLEKALAKAREKKIYPTQLSFNTDYNSPMYREVNGKADLAFVADTARLLLDQKLTAHDHLQQYCSEFAWVLLSLKDCNPDNTASDFKKGKTPSCVSEFFKPMQMFGSAFSSGSAKDQDFYGMTDGIPMLISQTGASPQLSMQLIDFALPGTDREAKGLSAGHKGVAKLMAPLIQQANGYFKLTLTRDAKQIDGARAQLNPNSTRNYSPTGFVVHAGMPDSVNGAKVAQKKLDYVVTIKYVPKAKLKDLQSK